MAAAQLMIPGTDRLAGERARAAGMARAEAGTPADWATICDAAIVIMAARQVPFQASDLVREGLVAEPDHPSRWGPRLRSAAWRGVIRSTGAVPSSRVTVHRSLCREWIGTAAGAAEGSGR